jgi:aspartyl protease family protein
VLGVGVLGWPGNDRTQEMRAAIIVFLLVAAAGTFASQHLDKFYARPGQAQAQAVMTATKAPTSLPSSNTGRTVTLQSDGRGHFQVDARVDGRQIDFLVDTGASVIALRESAAARLGIHPTPRDYTAKAHTANGVTKAAPIMLNRVEVNGITVRDVRAFVMSDDALGTNLLGMSFLSRVKWTHDKGRLVLEQ